MPLSYRGRLRRDVQRWQEKGLIQPDQARRLIAEALPARGLAPLQFALVLCFVLLAAPAVIAFVAANWSAMPPTLRFVMLLIGDAATLLVSCLALRRHACAPGGPARWLADAAATLSLAFAAAMLALVAQTFHVPPDTRGFAVTLALLGTATALVARSGGAAFVACAALFAADAGFLSRSSATQIVDGSAAGFWLVGPSLFLATLLGWLPARQATFLLLLITFVNHLGDAPAGLPFLVSPDRILIVAAAAMALGHLLWSPAREATVDDRPIPLRRWPVALSRAWEARLRDGGQALTHAAASLCLIGIAAAASRAAGLGGRGGGLLTVPALVIIALTGFLLYRRWRAGTEASSLADLMVLGASTLGLLVWLSLGSLRHASPFWTVLGGIVPALALVVAGHIDERRGLFGWALALCGALTIGMLAASGNLIGFSGSMLACALLVALALAASRWIDRRLAGRLA